jgi:hypothetical protein
LAAKRLEESLWNIHLKRVSLLEKEGISSSNLHGIPNELKMSDNERDLLLSAI